MNGVTFGTYHSYDAWGLLLGSKEIEAPKPKTTLVEIEGGDGVLDMTEFFGIVRYKNRSLSFTFYKLNTSPSDFLKLFTTIQNAVHGKVYNIYVDDDPLYYYRGRVTVNEWKSEKNHGQIVIDVDAEPYKYEVNETVITSGFIDGSVEISLPNGKKRVHPTITADAPMKYTFGGGTYSRNAGTFQISELELNEWNNSVLVAGTGIVSFKYRKAVL